MGRRESQEEVFPDELAAWRGVDGRTHRSAAAASCRASLAATEVGSRPSTLGVASDGRCPGSWRDGQRMPPPSRRPSPAISGWVLQDRGF